MTSQEEQWFVAEVSQRKVGPAKVQLVRARTYTGTSGWHYDHWKGPFYPSGLPEKAFLEYYAGSFATAEINNSFYRLPERETLLRWRSAVPEDFVFSVKASRYLTHMKKLKDPKEPLERLFDRVDALGKNSGQYCSSSRPGGDRTRSGWKASWRHCPRADPTPSSSVTAAGSTKGYTNS